MNKDLLKKVRDEFSGIELDYKKEIEKLLGYKIKIKGEKK